MHVSIENVSAYLCRIQLSYAVSYAVLISIPVLSLLQTDIPACEYQIILYPFFNWFQQCVCFWKRPFSSSLDKTLLFCWILVLQSTGDKPVNRVLQMSNFYCRIQGILPCHAPPRAVSKFFVWKPYHWGNAQSPKVKIEEAGENPTRRSDGVKIQLDAGWQVEKDLVRVSGGRGRPPTDTYKESWLHMQKMDRSHDDRYAESYMIRAETLNMRFAVRYQMAMRV